MIQPVDYGDVQFFRMARPYFGQVVYWTGVYYLDGLLIDSGPPNVAGEARVLFRDLDIKQAVTTHHHEDHSGNNPLLVDEFSVVPMVHPKSPELVARIASRLEIYRRVIWGSPRTSRTRPLDGCIETDRFRFEVLPTPGHSEDHVALFEPRRRWLFTGDLYLAPKLRVLRADEDVHALMESLNKAARLEPEVIFCQHRGRVEDATRMLQLKLDYLRELEERVLDLHERGLPEEAVARALPGKDLMWRLGTNGHFSKRNFVRSVLARNRPFGERLR